MDGNNEAMAANDAEAMDACNHQPPGRVGEFHPMDDSNGGESAANVRMIGGNNTMMAANATTAMVANAAMAANAGTMLEALNRHNGTNGVSATNDVSERSFASTQLWYGSLQYSLNTTMVTNATAAMVANATMAPNAGTMIDDGVAATNDVSERPFASSIYARNIYGFSQHSV